MSTVASVEIVYERYKRTDDFSGWLTLSKDLFNSVVSYCTKINETKSDRTKPNQTKRRFLNQACPPLSSSVLEEIKSLSVLPPAIPASCPVLERIACALFFLWGRTFPKVKDFLCSQVFTLLLLWMEPWTYQMLGTYLFNEWIVERRKLWLLRQQVSLTQVHAGKCTNICIQNLHSWLP